MKRKMWIALCVAQVLSAGTIIQAVDNSLPNSMQLNDPGSATTRTAAVSWTLNQTYTNVNVSAWLFGTEQYTAFLTNSIGPGTTAANNVAVPVTNFSQPSDLPFPGTPTQLFSSLTLTPGTYYLIVQALNNNDGGVLWESKAGLSPTFGAGVTGGEFFHASNDGQFGSLNAAFAPASTFAQPSIGGSVYYSVTGDSQSSDAATPEPATMAIVGAGLLVLGLARRKR